MYLKNVHYYVNQEKLARGILFNLSTVREAQFELGKPLSPNLIKSTRVSLLHVIQTKSLYAIKVSLVPN